MEIKRYTCGNGDGMFELKNGNYVEFSELVQYANQRVIEELDKLNNPNDDYATIGANLFFRIKELKK